MKISKLSAVLALAVSTAAISSFSAQATDGTITFNGRVTDQTCTISTPGGKDFTVTLPTVSASTLAAQSATAGRTPFAINLSDCSKEGANKQVISSQADSLIKISRIWADFFPANTSNQPI
ncbi:fimbrial protein [Enterobacter hormaechei]|uniref:fimbrial protein n=1 Tax=Enterobacter hormaechei TaxID=158836 RepID=UPI0033524CF3